MKDGARQPWRRPEGLVGNAFTVDFGDTFQINRQPARLSGQGILKRMLRELPNKGRKRAADFFECLVAVVSQLIKARHFRLVELKGKFSTPPEAGRFFKGR